jgi:hypothetical protein
MLYQKVKKILEADQKDRKWLKENNLYNNITATTKVIKRDKARLEKIFTILNFKQKLSKKTLFLCAVILSHGLAYKDQLQAAAIAKESLEMGYERAKSIYRSTLDRFFVYRYKKQKYGTQVRKTKKGWKPYLIDKTLKNPV